MTNLHQLRTCISRGDGVRTMSPGGFNKVTENVSPRSTRFRVRWFPSRGPLAAWGLPVAAIRSRLRSASLTESDLQSPSGQSAILRGIQFAPANEFLWENSVK